MRRAAGEGGEGGGGGGGESGRVGAGGRGEIIFKPAAKGYGRRRRRRQAGDQSYRRRRCCADACPVHTENIEKKVHTEKLRAGKKDVSIRIMWLHTESARLEGARLRHGHIGLRT